MANPRTTRQSISLPRRIAKRVKTMAKAGRTSANHVLVNLIEKGLVSKETEKREFLALADRLAASTDTRERKRLKQKLAVMTFGQ